jgi:hypothetical protein
MDMYISGSDAAGSSGGDGVFGLTFALIGRNPVCGCPLAIDMNPSKQSQQELEDRGLLLEFMAADAAQYVWDNSSWPCHHSKTVLEE